MSRTQGWVTGVAMTALIGAGTIAAIVFWLLVSAPDQVSLAAGTNGHATLGGWILQALQRLLSWL